VHQVGFYCTDFLSCQEFTAAGYLKHQLIHAHFLLRK